MLETAVDLSCWDVLEAPVTSAGELDDVARGKAVIALATLQFASGGLLGARAHEGLHLVRSTAAGTPGPTLCGRDRFAKDAPGWSVRGGVTTPDGSYRGCLECTLVRAEQYPALPVVGLVAFVRAFPAPTTG